MNLIVKSALAALVASASLGSVSAFAQNAACTCATPYRGAGQIGSIGRTKGNVMVSQATGYEAARSGGGLDFGSRVVVGAKSSASVQVGDCRLSVPANSSLDISRVENKICLKVEGSQQSAAGVSSEKTGAIGDPVAPRYVPAAIFFGMAGVAGVMAATQEDGTAVSQ